MFECLTLLKIEVIEYGKIGFKMAGIAFSDTYILKKIQGENPGPHLMKGGGGLTPLSYSPPSRLSPLGSRLRLSVHPGNNISGSGPGYHCGAHVNSPFMSTLYRASSNTCIFENTPIQYSASFHSCKNDNFQVKNCNSFLILLKT